MMIAATSWNRCRHQSMPEVSSTPAARATALPTIAPRMPKMVVSQSGLCCFPGMIALAMIPSTNPTMIAHNQPMTASSYGSTRALPPVFGRTAYGACRIRPNGAPRPCRPAEDRPRAEWVPRSRGRRGGGVTW